MPAPIELLKHVPLFHGLDDKQLDTLSRNFTDRTFTSGQQVTAEGSGGVGFFVIESGEATVSVGSDDRGTLGPGDYFGEVALIDEGARSVDDHRDERLALLRVDAVAVPPARRGQRVDRVAAAAVDGEAPAGDRGALTRRGGELERQLLAQLDQILGRERRVA